GGGIGGWLRGASGFGKRVTTPMLVMRPMWQVRFSVYHSAPSGPDVMSKGATSVNPAGNSPIPPTTVCPILLAPYSVNHSAPSGPVVMPIGLLLGVGTGISVITPAVVMRPIRLVRC